MPFKRADFRVGPNPDMALKSISHTLPVAKF